MNLVDTQIISYAISRNKRVDVDQKAISSICAQELLLVQGGSYRENQYYIPLLQILRSQGAQYTYLKQINDRSSNQRRRAMQRRTDKFVMEFGIDFPRVVEYSHLAIAEAINTKRFDLLAGCIRELPRESRRAALRRLEFLATTEMRCIPLTVDIAEIALALFGVFSRKYALKVRFRNSLNDILSVAVASHNDMSLETHDRLLGEFISGPAQEVLLQRRSQSEGSGRGRTARPNHESKGYINRGWRVMRTR